MQSGDRERMKQGKKKGRIVLSRVHIEVMEWGGGVLGNFVS